MPSPSTRPGRTTLERALSRRDLPLREKTLWRMLFETAARANEILALNVEDLDLDARRAPVRSKGGDTEWIYWGSGTAHLLPRLRRGREAEPVFLSERRPSPARRPNGRDLCPSTGRARLGFDRARALFTAHTGWGAAPTARLGRHLPRRARHTATADHSQDPAQEPMHRDALHQTRRPGRSRRHRNTPATAPQRLTRNAAGQCSQLTCHQDHR